MKGTLMVTSPFSRSFPMLMKRGMHPPSPMQGDSVPYFMDHLDRVGAVVSDSGQ